MTSTSCLRAGALAGAFAFLAACSDAGPVAAGPAPQAEPAVAGLARMDCQAEVASGLLSCEAPRPVAGGARAAIVGGQGTHVRLASTPGGYDPETQLYTIHVTLQNLLAQAMGTRDGVSPDANGVRVFFHSGPSSMEGVVSVANETGSDLFLGSSQPFFRYHGILSRDEVSPSQPWTFNVPATVTRFTFSVYVEAALEPRLVINEVMPNPAAVTDEAGEWFEVHNTGLEAVDLQGWRIASGNDAVQTVNASVVVPARGYVVLGRNTAPATNGGVPVAYAYGTLALNNSNSDWLALRTPAGASHDSVHWGGAANVPNGASRALSDAALDNTVLMGASWATSTAVYGAGTDRGTPGVATAGGGSTTPPPAAGPATSLVVSPATATVAVGATRQLAATARDAGGQVTSTTVTWTTLDAARATVNTAGLVSGVAAGDARIVATASTGVADTALVTVTAATSSGVVFRNHVEFGIPTDGSSADDVLLNKREFAASHNPARGGPNWVSWNLNATHFGAAARCNCFAADAQLPDGVYRVVTSDYTGSGYSRGHMVMSEQRTATGGDNAITFLMTNILPQIQDMNGGPWLQHEIHTNDLARVSGKEVYNIAGGIYPAQPQFLNGAGKVAIPTSTWKIVVVLEGGRGLADVRSAADLQISVVNMPNQAGIQSNPWSMYRTSVDAVEAATGYDFLAALPDDIEAAIEAQVN